MADRLRAPSTLKPTSEEQAWEQVQLQNNALDQYTHCTVG